MPELVLPGNVLTEGGASLRPLWLRADWHGIALDHAPVLYQHDAGRLRVLTAALMPISGESTMHPDFSAEIMKARTSDAHRRADRDRLARAVGQDHPAQRRGGIRRLLPRLRFRPVLRRLAGDQAAP